MSIFGELKQKVEKWSLEDEDVLLRKLKLFSDDYTKKCENLKITMKNIDININLLEFEYLNVQNKIKNISKRRFMEHVIDITNIGNDNPIGHPTNPVQNSNKSNNVIITREERENKMLGKFKSAFTRSLENLASLRNTSNENKENNDNLSIIEDDNISLASSKILSGINKAFKNGKLPLIYGTADFRSSKYLGLIEENQNVLNNLNNNLNSEIASLKNNENNPSQSTNLIKKQSVQINQNQNQSFGNQAFNNNGIMNENNFNYLNAANNYDNNQFYNNQKNSEFYQSRPSIVSEIGRPNFQQLIDSEISFNKKTSMEFNLQNTVHFSGNFNNPTKQIIPPGIPNIPNIPSIASNSNENKAKNLKVLGNINQKDIPKAPPLNLKIPIIESQTNLPKIPTENLQNKSNNSLLDEINNKIQSNKEKRNQNKADTILKDLDDSNTIKINENNEENKPISFKDNLNAMFAMRGGRPIQKQISNPVNIEQNRNTIDENIKQNTLAQDTNLQNNKTSHTESNNFDNDNNKSNNRAMSLLSKPLEKSKSILLNNFVNKNSLFENEEDDEDNTGLFGKNNSNKNFYLMKKNTTSVIEEVPEILESQTSTFDNENNNVTNNSKNKNFVGNYNTDNQNNLNLNNKNLFSEDNLQNESKFMYTKNPINKRNTMKGIGLEKAKNTLNSIFGDEDEDSTKITENKTTQQINKKSNDINKRLNNLFEVENKDDKKLTTYDAIQSKNIASGNKILNTTDQLKNNSIKKEEEINNNISETKKLGNVLENPLTKMVTIKNKTQDKSNVKPDLNKLNKLFLAEEDDELDFKNINFKKEEKKITNPQAKELPKSSDIWNNIANLEANKTEKQDNKPNENNFKGNPIEVNITNKNEKTGGIFENSEEFIEMNDEQEQMNKNIPKLSDQFSGEVNPKKESSQKSPVQPIVDPLSMIKASIQNKNRGVITAIEGPLINKKKIEEIKKLDKSPNYDDEEIIHEKVNIPKKTNEIKLGKNIEDDEKESGKNISETITTGKVSDISKILGAKLIFPGFPQKKVEISNNDDYLFKPPSNKRKILERNEISENLKINNEDSTSRPRNQSHCSDEENEKINKMILDRPVIKNKKKQKIKKMILEDSTNIDSITDKSKNLQSNKNEKVSDIDLSYKIDLDKIEERKVEISENLEESGKEEKIDINLEVNFKKREQNEKEENKIEQMEELPNLSENKMSIQQKKSISFEKIPSKELNIPLKNQKIKNLFGEVEENTDPLSLMSRKTVKPKKSLADPLAFLNGDEKSTTKKNITAKKQSIFDEEEKPDKDIKDNLFQLPKKKTNLKKLSFLDENEEEDSLANIKKNSTVIIKDNKDTKKKEAAERLKFLLDD